MNAWTVPNLDQIKRLRPYISGSNNIPRGHGIINFGTHVYDLSNAIFIIIIIIGTIFRT
jgi:hypothetical protein